MMEMPERARQSNRSLSTTERTARERWLVSQVKSKEQLEQEADTGKQQEKQDKTEKQQRETKREKQKIKDKREKQQEMGKRNRNRRRQRSSRLEILWWRSMRKSG